MSGIYGLIDQLDAASLGDRLQVMRDALPVRPGLLEKQWSDDHGAAAFGAINTGARQEGAAFASDEYSGVVCFFDGVVYGLNIEPDPARLLLDQYLQSGIDALKHVNGHFTVAWWDPRSRTLTLAVDKTGQKPLFYAGHNGTFAFASMPARVLAAAHSFGEIDPEAFAQLLAFQHVLGERTLFKHVRTLPPAGYLIANDRGLTADRYWRIDDIQPHGVLNSSRMDELEHAFDTAVRRAVDPEAEPVILLTGGLDSRAILASAVKQRLPLRTLTTGDSDNKDVQLAKTLADATGAEHTHQLIPSESLAEWLPLMAQCLGGIVATLHSHPCQALFKQDTTPVVHGVGGEYARGFWEPSRHLSHLAAAETFLLARMTGNRRPYIDRIWRPEHSELAAVPRLTLRERMRSYAPTSSPLDVLHYIYLHDRCRTFINKGILIDRNVRDDRMPFLDHEWLETVTAVPIAERLRRSIQIELIRRACPRLLDVPYAKDLIPLSAPPWRRTITHGWQRVLRKVQSHAGRLYTARAGATPSAEVGASYSRNEMKATLTELLYDPNAAFHEYLRWDAVKLLLDNHFAGGQDVDSLIAALSTFELANKTQRPPQTQPSTQPQPSLAYALGSASADNSVARPQ